VTSPSARSPSTGDGRTSPRRCSDDILRIIGAVSDRRRGIRIVVTRRIGARRSACRHSKQPRPPLEAGRGERRVSCAWRVRHHIDDGFNRDD
jgi:hypothetical protein